MSDLVVSQYAVSGRVVIDRTKEGLWAIRSGEKACLCKDGKWIVEPLIHVDEMRSAEYNDRCRFETPEEAHEFWKRNERRYHSSIVYVD